MNDRQLETVKQVGEFLAGTEIVRKYSSSLFQYEMILNQECESNVK